MRQTKQIPPTPASQTPFSPHTPTNQLKFPFETPKKSDNTWAKNVLPILLIFAGWIFYSKLGPEIKGLMGCQPPSSTAPKLKPPEPAPAVSPVVAPAPSSATAQASIPSPASPADFTDTATVEPLPEPPSTVQWTFEGLMYDMLTLQPVADAQMIFSLNKRTGDFRSTQTNDQGRYRIVLPGLKSGGYSLKVTHYDYCDYYFDEIQTSYRKLELSERKALKGIRSVHRPWIGKAAGRTRRDIVLYPEITARMDEAPAAAERKEQAAENIPE